MVLDGHRSGVRWSSRVQMLPHPLRRRRVPERHARRGRRRVEPAQGDVSIESPVFIFRLNS